MTAIMRITNPTTAAIVLHVHSWSFIGFIRCTTMRRRPTGRVVEAACGDGGAEASTGKVTPRLATVHRRLPRVSSRTIGARRGSRTLESATVGITSRRYVLVVEDEADTRRTVEKALRDADLETVAVADGDAALAQCRRRDPAVIVLDLALPGLDGVKFADAYRRQAEQGSARIIVISGTPRGGETAAKMRAYAYFSKPFRLDRLVEAAAKLVAG